MGYPGTAGSQIWDIRGNTPIWGPKWGQNRVILGPASAQKCIFAYPYPCKSEKCYFWVILGILGESGKCGKSWIILESCGILIPCDLPILIEIIGFLSKTQNLPFWSQNRPKYPKYPIFIKVHFAHFLHPSKIARF